MWSYDTGCKYHTQDTGYYCGAAAAMMILAEIGVPIANLDQDILYNLNHSHSGPGWATSADGLCWTLNDQRPTGPYWFNVNRHLTENDGTCKLVDTLYRFKVSPAVLVYGCMHWIVVREIATDNEPKPGVSYNIQWLRINNPVHYDSPPPPPHADADACGTGGVHGVEAQFVAYNTWNSTYFTGCASDPQALGQTRFISVCDPEPPKVESPGRLPREFLIPGHELATPDEVRRLVNPELERFNLISHPVVEEKVARASETGTPELVMRSDLVDTYYYLVPMETGDGTTALAQMDGRFGNLESLSVLREPVKRWAISEKQVHKLVENKRFKMEPRVPHIEEIERLRGGLDTETFGLLQPIRRIERELILKPTWVKILPGTYNVSPTLVWEPCSESWSPHLPFRIVNFGPHKFYVRIDGQVFSSLTTVGKGI